MGLIGIGKGAYNFYQGWKEGDDRIDKGVRQIKWGIMTTIIDPLGVSDGIADAAGVFDED